jgi:type III secretion protein W
MTETRSVQSVLGVYRFFQGRMNLVDSQFEKEGLDKPPQLSFENMAKTFMGLASERYPSSNKVKDSASRLGVEKSIQAKFITLSQLRDAVKEVSLPQVFKSVQHRDELYMAILMASEDYEEELEELTDLQREQDAYSEVDLSEKAQKPADDDDEELRKILKDRLK